MFKNELPRVYELIDLIKVDNNPSHYFYDFDNSCCNELKRDAWHVREKQFETLDNEAWEYLKNKVSSCVMKPDYVKSGWWHQLFEVLNEASGYSYIKSIGCTDIEFIQPSIVKGVETPDLKGKLNDCLVLCEVKTINISAEESYFRRFGECRRTTSVQLGIQFLEKLIGVISKAQSQMRAYNDETTTRRIVYIIINFNDLLGEYSEQYYKEIDGYLIKNKPADAEVVFHNQKTCFHRELAMTSADIINE